MKKVIHEAETRGVAYHGWLVSNHTFSFAGYRNPKRMNFGFLRVLNDNRVSAGEGFGMHPSEDIEVIIIPLSGAMRYKDNKGNEFVLHPGDVHALSAGTGVMHSEYNDSDIESLKFLELRIQAKEHGIAPVCFQKFFSEIERINAWQMLVSGDKSDKVVTINQDAYISRIYLEGGKKSIYKKKRAHHGVYFFLIDGKGIIAGEHLRPRDGIGVETNHTEINLHAKTDFDVLAIEVPMS